MIVQRFFLFIFLCQALGASITALAQDNKSIDSLKETINHVAPNQPEKKAALYIALGKQYYNRTNYLDAVNSYEIGLSIAEKIKNDTLMASCYLELGRVQLQQHNFSKQTEYDFKALEIYQKKHDRAHVAFVLKSLGDCYLQHHDSLNAQKYYQAALPIFFQTNDLKNAAGIYMNQAIIATPNHRKRIELGLKAKKIWDADPVESTLPIINTGNIGIVYLELVKSKAYQVMLHDTLISANEGENLKKAEYYLQSAIQMSQLKNDAEDVGYYSGAMAELQEYKGDFKKAYYNIRKYYETQDSIYSQENKNKIATLESRNEINKKDQEIRQQKATAQRNSLILLSGLLIIGTIGFLYYRLSTIRKQKNEELTKLNTELDEANKVKAKFFGILSHDLRSPVANLMNFLQLQKLKPGLLNEQQVAERENKISLSAKSLLETMEAMLLWSKGQMEHFKPSVSAVPVKLLFDYLQQFFAGTEHIAFIFSGDENLIVQTDENFLKTIMQNLTANAIQALHQKPDAQISWKAWQKEGKIYLSITDNGPGINEQQLKALYDETANSSAKHGLGLHIIRDLAKAIGCSIILKPEPGFGSAFVLALNSTKIMEG